MPEASPLVREHLAKLSEFYDRATPKTNWATHGYRRLIAHYYRHLIPADASVLEIGCGGGELLALLPNRDVAGVDVSPAQVARAQQRVPHGTFHAQGGETLALDRTFDVILLSETLNFAADVQLLLTKIAAVATPRSRLICNFHSGVWRPALALGAALGLKGSAPQSNWLSSSDLRNLFDLADWQLVKMTPRLLCPFDVPVLGPLLNRGLAPLLPALCLTIFGVARSRRATGADVARSVTVVVPARNEAGNIEAAVQRTPLMGSETEILFIEGHSKDNTWAEIERVAAAYPDRRVRALRQTGKGKGNAVREAFAIAKGDILMILDADLTMPPEELPKFYDAIVSQHAEFANGVRLVYPMEEHAMQFLNLCANKTFGLIFSWLLGQPVKDTLCGTKVLLRADYEKIAANRAYFGDFDPFGDFDLLFGADRLNLKIADIPIRYRDRTYGSTNIQRWRHGWLLWRMVFFAARKLKFI